MGNIDSRAKFDGGFLFIKTDKPFYYPGNTVYGKIYLRVEVPICPVELSVRVKGKETSYCILEYNEEEGYVADERNYEKLIVDFKSVIYRFPQGLGPLNPGDYLFNFEFPLPDLIPASMIFEHGGNFPNRKMDSKNAYEYEKAKPKCQVKYSIKALIGMQNEEKPKMYKQIIVVHEKPVDFQHNANQDLTLEQE